jgi:CRP/FNR family transcriptional regulator
MKNDNLFVVEGSVYQSKTVYNYITSIGISSKLAFERIALFKKGEVVFTEGNYPSGLYFLDSGKIKITNSGFEGKNQIVRFAKDGDIMGYRALLSEGKYSCSAVALEQSVVRFVPKDSFIGLLKEDSVLMFKMLKLLSDDLRNSERRITELAQKPVRERLVETLIYLKDKYGFEEDCTTLNVVLSREELASIVGTATETIIRLLSEFKSDKIIELIGKKIKVNNFNLLKKTAKV